MVAPRRLPVSATPLVGRTRELMLLRQLLDGDVRAVTLTGPAGVGKTRLAIEVAAGLAADFAGRVVAVNLAPLLDPALVESAIATALGVEAPADGPLLQSIVAAVGDARVLMLLDNFEHVGEAAPVVAELLASCPNLEVLATSREVLRLSVERIFPVSPLDVPPDDTVTVNDLRGVEAVRLFVERSRMVSPDFAVTADNVAAVAEICRRLDGLPLAIELAAARANVLSPQAMLARWPTAFDLLQSGLRDLPLRQRTLRAAIAWSYELLGAEEQTAFRRLAVFVGGLTLEAVEAVCRGHHDDLPALPLDPVAVLSSLADKNLLRAEDDTRGERRFWMLMTIRDYARERLQEAGEVEAASRLHADYFLALAEQAALELQRSAQAAWLDRLDREHNNLRAALQWLLERNDAARSLRLSASLVEFWHGRYVQEGRQWLERAMTQGGPEQEPIPPALWARACHAAAVLAHRQGDYGRTRTLAEDELAAAQRAQDDFVIAQALLDLGMVLGLEGEDRVRGVLRESLQLFEKTGHRQGVARALNRLGEEARAGGRLEEAALFYEQALQQWEQTGDATGVAVGLHNLGQVAQQQGDLARAGDLFLRTMAACRQLGDRHRSAVCLTALAEAVAATGPPTRAASLVGAADAHMEAAGVRLEPLDRAVYERSSAQLREQLGEARFTQAWQQGRELTLDQAVALCERTLGRGARLSDEGPLTARELDVIRLVADGLSNAQIAARLVVSQHTVHRHVANILRKLGASSRAAAAASATRRGLL